MTEQDLRIILNGLPQQIKRMVDAQVSASIGQQLASNGTIAVAASRAAVTSGSSTGVHELDPASGKHTGTLPEADVAFDDSSGHTHTGASGAGTKIAHGDLTGIGTNTHAQIDSHIANTTTAHGAVSTNTASKLVVRDASARARFADPSAAQDAATKNYVDTSLVQYALLNGRSGGQTLIGGTDSGDDLTLQSTSNGTKGDVVFGAAGASAYQETNDALGIGTITNKSGYKLDVRGDGIFGDGSGDDVIYAGNRASGSNQVRGGIFVDNTNYEIGFSHQRAGNECAAMYAVSTSDNTGLIRFDTMNSGAASQKVRVTAEGNLILGGLIAAGSSAQRTLVLENGSAPSSSPSDSIQLYAKDLSSSSELYVLDEAGNETLLSPHAFVLFDPDPSYEAPWSYHSINRYTGYEINVDMFRLARAVESLTGEKIIHLRKLDDSETLDWDANEELKVQRSNEAIVEWERGKKEGARGNKAIQKPKKYVKKQPPKWLKMRIDKRAKENARRTNSAGIRS